MRITKVTTAGGVIVGEEKLSYRVFRGVPYAEPCIGENRFREPARKKPWQGELDCTAFREMCPQPDPTGGFYGKEFYTSPEYPLPGQSEDCLYLNIWAPFEYDRKNCPVAFWIHGGAFDHGFGSEMEFDGENFAVKGVILVTINYRVGVFGFYADEELDASSVGNLGILDQIEALKWVHNNIAAFGGDPENITIFGQSAGAASVQALLCSPLAVGLFHKAIMQSGGGYDNGLIAARTKEEAIETGKIIRELAGAKNLADMKKVDAKKLVDLLPALYGRLNKLAFGPVVDGYVLNKSFDQTLLDRETADVPIMIGMTSQDITVGKGEDARESRLYDGCLRFARFRSEQSVNPVYMYYFRRQLPGDDAGAFHSSELWYVFNTIGRCWRPMEVHDYRLSDMMANYWMAFMKGENLVSWKEFGKGEFVRSFQ